MAFHIDLLFKFIFELFSNNFNPSDISESLIYSVSPFQWSSTFSQPSTLPLILVMTSDTFVTVFFSTLISLLNFLFSLKSSSPFITIFLFFLFFNQFNSQIINFIKTVPYSSTLFSFIQYLQSLFKSQSHQYILSCNSFLFFFISSLNDIFALQLSLP